MKLGCSSYATQPHNLLFPSIKAPITKNSSNLARMDSTTTNPTLKIHRKEKVVVIMGATGAGKSRLSIDLATRFFPAEIINSDKIQVYRGLDITTNKIPLEDRRGVPHHLLGEFDSELGEVTPCKYRSVASSTIDDILGRNKLPLIVGGSNSFVHALLTDRFDGNSDVFNDVDNSGLSNELRYDCCFLWVDVGVSVLYEYLFRRVDDMFESGMLDELEEFFSESETQSGPKRVGIRKAIGVPEFEEYFSCGAQTKMDLAVQDIKKNTWQLALKQMEKIQRLRSAGWDLRRLDATEAFRWVLTSDFDKSADIWEKKLVEPSVKIVKRFLEE